VGKRTKIAKNSSHITSRAVRLDAVRRGQTEGRGFLTLMGVAAGATAGASHRPRWDATIRAATSIQHSFQAVSDAMDSPRFVRCAEIAVSAVAGGSVGAPPAPPGRRPDAFARDVQLSESIEEIGCSRMSCERVEVRRVRPEPVRTRVGAGAHRVPVRRGSGLVQGIQGIGVATTLATFEFEVDSPLATHAWSDGGERWSVAPRG
jgi:hypothetical protein